MILRPYQDRAVSETLRLWTEGHRSVLLVLATGLGKTVCATDLIRRRRSTGRALFLAHRTELIMQARSKMVGAGLTCEVEQADSRALAVSLTPSDVVVGSVQTMRDRRLTRWPRDAFTTIVVDEAHHAVAAGYRAILDHFRGAKVMGLTATPDRSDEVGLANIFDEVAANYGIREGIDDGYLVPIVAESLGNIDLSAVKTVRGDLHQGQLDEEVGRDSVLYAIAGALQDRTGDRPTLIFTPGVQAAHRLGEILGQLDGVGADNVASIDGTTDRALRAALLERFANRDLKYLVNCAVLTEGFDAPVVSCVAMARPTKSRALYSQCLGRGTRPLPGVVDGPETAEERRDAIAASAKPNVLLLDLTDRRRVDLVGPADVLAGEPLPEETRREIQRKVEGGDRRPLEEILQEAEQWGELAEQRRDEERRAGKIQVFAKYCSAPIELARMDDAHVEMWDEAVRSARSTKGPRNRLASEKQRALCQRYGIELPKSANVRQASAAIEVIKRSGLCSVRQARVLAKAGLPTDVSAKAASILIDKLRHKYDFRPVPAMHEWAEQHRIRQGVSDHAAE